MSQIDNPYVQEPEGRSTPKRVAGAAAKQVGKKVAKKAGTAVAAKLGWPILLIVGAFLLLLAGIAFAVVLIVASSGEEARPESSGFWGGEISEIGANEIPAVYI